MLGQVLDRNTADIERVSPSCLPLDSTDREVKEAVELLEIPTGGGVGNLCWRTHLRDFT
jgi:hypothetical protein